MSIRSRAAAGQRPASVGAPFMTVASAPVGGFCSVPDLNEHEALVSRVASLETQLATSISGYSTFEASFRAQLVEYTAMTGRMGEVERAVTKCTAELKELRGKQERFESAQLGRETRLQQMERMLARFDDRLRACEARMASMRGNGPKARAKGFQENDQPARFMGDGR
ncbi:MAG: hypothetical protein ACKVI4_15010 [Actinomycetales bacterium]